MRRASPPAATRWAVFVAVLVATVLQPTGRFLFDAYGYWSASGALIGGDAPLPEGFWDLRGVASAVVYVPAQLVTAVLGPDASGMAVLLQNALLLAAAAAFLVPALVRPWSTLSPAAHGVAAAAFWLAARGFAPYPLMDLPVALAVMLAAYLLYSGRWLRLLTAGLILGAAFNIRPAYLVPLALVLLVVAWYHRLRTLVVLAGAALALVPQAVYLMASGFGFGIVPVQGTALIGLQTSYAAYTVRYDTALTSSMPQQFFCSPDMASSMTEAPLTLPALAHTLATSLPHSLVFAVEKVGAALHWPISIPYLVPYPGVNALFAVLVTTVAVAGAVVLLARRPTPENRGGPAHALVAALVLGTTATLVSSATEARFALLLVLLAAAGTGVLVDRPPRWRASRAERVVPVVGAVLVALLLGAGWAGLAHPAPPGGVTLDTCAQLDP